MSGYSNKVSFAAVRQVLLKRRWSTFAAKHVASELGVTPQGVGCVFRQLKTLGFVEKVGNQVWKADYDKLEAWSTQYEVKGVESKVSIDKTVWRGCVSPGRNIQYVLLRSIDIVGECTGYGLLGSIYNHLGVLLSQGTVYPHLYRLLDQGYLNREVVGSRRKLYSLTEKGKSLLENYHSALNALIKFEIP